MSTSIPLSGQHHEGDHPELENHASEPKGVIRRNLKMQVYLGIAVLFIIATAISSLRHKPAANSRVCRRLPWCKTQTQILKK